MSTEAEKNQIPITNRKTGEVRLSDPMPMQTPNTQSADSITQAAAETPASAPESAMATQGDDGNSTKKPTKATKPAKPKLEIETFEQFIEYAYRRRGQPVKLESKVQKVIAKQTSLDETAMGRLLVLANADALLVVPRQILLASKEVSGFPPLRGALIDLVAEVMLRHQVFASNDVKAAVRNLPGAPTPAEALATVARYTPQEVDGTEPLKPTELKELRRNAIHLLATWFALHRSVSLEDLTNLIFHALWEPAARELANDSERLRALTDAEHAAGMGVAAQGYRQRVAEARNEREQALRETVALRQQVTGLIAQRDAVQVQLDERTAELQTLRASSAHELAALHETHNAGRMQQGHEYESLRGRLVKRLEESIEMLDTGLSALRRETQTPRVSVMVQRAEVVLDALRSELNNLREV